jgi:hypothetical protein
MLKVISLAAMSALGLVTVATSQPALAHDGGAIAAGVIGGLAVGAIIGSQSQRNYYGGPNYVEPGYEPVYGACHVEREHFVDQYGRDRSRRVQVCD